MDKVLLGLKQILTCFSLAIALSIPSVGMANPTGGEVVAGSAAFSHPNDTTLHITQSTDQAILNWQSFNINNGETTRFIQPSSSSVTLNRITGSVAPSQILGTLSANGQLFLVNPAGIFFGHNATIDVGGLVASTANISNEDFLARNYRFTSSGNTQGSIINEGSIIAKQHGLVALMAPQVENNGLIQAQGGTIALASGNAFTLNLGDIHFAVHVDESAAQANAGLRNRGQLIADGGRILLTAEVAKGVVDNVINLDGVAQANSVGMQNGSIILSAGKYGNVRVGGKVLARGENSGETGGSVKVAGKHILIASTAEMDVSGYSGGGQVLIGGGFQGQPILPEYSTEIANAESTLIDRGAYINADATTNGDGGSIIAWADNMAQVHGTLMARGGSEGGDGGFVETSSAGTLDVAHAQVNTLAPHGHTGLWLLDPTDFIIDTTQAASLMASLATTNADVTATGDIYANAPITWSAATTLTLTAGESIFLNLGGDITGLSGSLVLDAANVAQSITSSTNPTAGVQANIQVANLTIEQGSWYQNASTLPTLSVTDNFQLAAGTTYNNAFDAQFTRITGGDGVDTFTVADIFGLQGIATTALDGIYTLANDIDASVTANWFTSSLVQGFIPIAPDTALPFSGSLDGQGFVISHLTILNDAENVGLIGMLNSTGVTGGTVSNIGTRFSTITGSAASASQSIGGLVGYMGNEDFAGTTISNSFADSSITANVNSTVGGLVGGIRNGTVQSSYSTGTLASTASRVGGLIGGVNMVGGTFVIDQSYSAFNIPFTVTRGGGFIGGTSSEDGGTLTISNSYALGAVSSGTNIGGFIGDIADDPGSISISNSYSAGFVGTGTNANGFVGIKSGAIPVTYSNNFWDTSTTGEANSAPGSPAGITAGTFATTLSIPSTFTDANWNFTTIWGIVSGLSYPYLLAIDPVAPVFLSGTTSIGSNQNVSLAIEGANTHNARTGANQFYYFQVPTSFLDATTAALIYVNNGVNTGNILTVPNGGSQTALNPATNTIAITGTNGIGSDAIIAAKGSLSSSSILYNTSGSNITIPSATLNAINVPFTLSGGITFGSTNSFVFNQGVTLGTQTNNFLTTAIGDITINNGVTGNGKNLTLTATDNVNTIITLGGTISDLGTFTVHANGTGGIGSPLTISVGVLDDITTTTFNLGGGLTSATFNGAISDMESFTLRTAAPAVIGAFNISFAAPMSNVTTTTINLSSIGDSGALAFNALSNIGTLTIVEALNPFLGSATNAMTFNGALSNIGQLSMALSGFDTTNTMTFHAPLSNLGTGTFNVNNALPTTWTFNSGASIDEATSLTFTGHSGATSTYSFAGAVTDVGTLSILPGSINDTVTFTNMLARLDNLNITTGRTFNFSTLTDIGNLILTSTGTGTNIFNFNDAASIGNTWTITGSGTANNFTFADPVSNVDRLTIIGSDNLASADSFTFNGLVSTVDFLTLQLGAGTNTFSFPGAFSNVTNMIVYGHPSSTMLPMTSAISGPTNLTFQARTAGGTVTLSSPLSNINNLTVGGTQGSDMISSTSTYGNVARFVAQDTRIGDNDTLNMDFTNRTVVHLTSSTGFITGISGLNIAFFFNIENIVAKAGDFLIGPEVVRVAFAPLDVNTQGNMAEAYLNYASLTPSALIGATSQDYSIQDFSNTTRLIDESLWNMSTSLGVECENVFLDDMQICK